MKTTRLLLSILSAICLLPFSLRAAELQVFAAASLTDVLQEIAPLYEKSSGNKVYFNFAGSNILARQIQEGAPADVFISADELKMDGLEKAGDLLAGTRGSLLSNTLAIVVGVDSTMAQNSPQILTGPNVKRIALADPMAVPAGMYAMTWLEEIGLWKTVKDRVVATENVRAALAVVVAGNADVGIVYKTDAASSKAVKVIYEVPAGQGPDISYPVAVVKGAKDADAARDFLAYLKSAPAQAAFKKAGFGVKP